MPDMRKYLIKTSVHVEVWAEDPKDAAQTAVDRITNTPNMDLLEVHGYQVHSNPSR